MVSKLIVPVLAVLLLLGTATAAEYPCPSDPGFCYRDIGNDGCFDSGFDEGPINDEIEDSEEFPVVPGLGSIVCPPSVGQLSASDTSIRLETMLGSSILLYGATITVSSTFSTISGGNLLIGGSRVNGAASQSHVAVGGARLEGKLKLGTFGSPTFYLESQTGDVTLGAKARVKTGGDITLSAAGGAISLLKNAVLQATNNSVVRLDAGGPIEMTRPKITSAALVLDASDISVAEAATFKTGYAIFDAKPGDVVIDRMSVTAGAQGFLAPLVISGTNVTIGVSDKGRTPRSKINYKGDQDVFIEATDAIDIDNLVLKSRTNVNIDATGQTVDLINSKLIGIKNTPSFEVSAGPGSTCDFTRTVVKKATLVTNCDTVVGP